MSTPPTGLISPGERTVVWMVLSANYPGIQESTAAVILCEWHKRDLLSAEFLENFQWSSQWVTVLLTVHWTHKFPETFSISTAHNVNTWTMVRNKKNLRCWGHFNSILTVALPLCSSSCSERRSKQFPRKRTVRWAFNASQKNLWPTFHLFSSSRCHKNCHVPFSHWIHL